MAKKIDKLLVIDIEATCWEEEPPDHQKSEIIEIGVTVVSLPQLQCETSDGLLVNTHGSRVSEFCTLLTTLTQDLVDQGMPFHAACIKLQNEYKSKERAWASWGDYDRRQFERQCSRREFSAAKYPFSTTHLNLKNLFALELGLSREVGMDKALEILGIELTGTHHRAVDDAQNIARIACELLKPGRKYFQNLT
ncbi:MAG: exonuclease domain-containing protein [Promethearchaeota archaeon]|jgi:inhibitor of KinA sporulation pathway (predicted exonuclease)